MFDSNYRNICEKLGWTVIDEGDTIELTKTSPLGEDFIFNSPANGFVEDVAEFSKAFSPDRHAESWIETFGKNGDKSRRQLYDDAEAIQKMLVELADGLIEFLWESLEDVPIDEDECIDIDWLIFDKGTWREYIWNWFDVHHSKGVGWLMEEYEG